MKPHCSECEKRIGRKYRRRKQSFKPPVITKSGLAKLPIECKKPITFSNEYRELVKEVMQDAKNRKS